MKKAIKRNAKKTIGAVAAVAIAATMSFSGVTAFAAKDDILKEGPYNSAYNSFKEVEDAAAELNVKLAGEGFVLMKNNNNVLPLKNATATSKQKVTVLGAFAKNPYTGGLGSGAQGKPSVLPQGSVKTDIYMGLGEKFDINAKVKDIYAGLDLKQLETGGQFGGQYREPGHYMELAENGTVEFDGNKYSAIADSATGDDAATIKAADIAGYTELAVVVISRSGSEGGDNPSHHVDGHTDVNEHYLELDDAEKEMFAYAKSNFDKIVVLLNTPSVMEVRNLQEDDKVDAILQIGLTGWNGAEAIGKVLTGEVTPSGRTVDFWMSDFTTDPTWYNYGTYQQAAYAANGGENYNNSLDGESQIADNPFPMGHIEGSRYSNTQYAVDYAEGIYMGYRYYETVAADLTEAEKDGEKWYNEVTTYPFGYGLSYTTFSQEITEVTGDLTAANKDGEVTVKVKVKNTGSVKGKEVVQLYAHKPYTKGGIEKAEVDLVGFAKTAELAPEAEETVTIKVDVKEFASFDYNDANKNQNSGYELEAGNYVLSIRKDSHHLANADATKATHTLNAAALITWDEDGDSTTPNNIYSQPMDSKWGQFNTLSHTWTESHKDYYLTRDKLLDEKSNVADLVPLAWMYVDDRANNVFLDEAFAVLATRGDDVSVDNDKAITPDKETDYENLWVKTAEDMRGKTQGTGVKGSNGMYAISLYDMKNVGYDDAKWDTFLDQLTWDEMKAVVSNGGYGNPALATVGKPSCRDTDGPGQLRAGGWGWTCNTIISSTWNEDLCYQQGAIVGEETMWLNCNGWYGPGSNTHRNPLAGRNFEYFSQDGLQGGVLITAVVKGATDKGAHVYLKHSFLNDQEAGRNNEAIFVTEQAIREIYVKPFELAAKKGNCNGYMNSFNLIGISSSVNYAVSVQMYTNEWGFYGMNVTDWWGSFRGSSCGWTSNAMVRGLTMPLVGMGSSTLDGTWDNTAKVVKIGDTANYTQWYWTRETCKRLMFTIANSNAMMNGAASVVSGATVEAKQGEELTPVTVAIDKTTLSAAVGEAGYTLTATGLPEGLTFNAETATISGTPTQAGTFNARVTAKGNGGAGWITSTATIAFEIEAAKPDLKFAGVDSLIAGFGYNAQIIFNKVNLVEGVNYVYFEDLQSTLNTPGVIEPNDYDYWYCNLSYSATGLPEGLTIDSETGAITGTPTKTGEYTVTITARIGQLDWHHYSWAQPAVDFTNHTLELKLTVDKVVSDVTVSEGKVVVTYSDGTTENLEVGGSSTTPTEVKGIKSATINDNGELVLTYTDDTTANLGKVVGANGANGAQGPEGPAGPVGPQGEAGSGCGGSIESTVAAVAVSFALVAGAVIVMRKRKENK